MNTKIFCTFVEREQIDGLLEYLRSKYTIPFGKVFGLSTEEQEKYILTYNVENSNTLFPENTISVHRKKQTNTLYTINALNCLVKKLNGGILDSRFEIDWEEYRNSLLLTRGFEFQRIRTKLYKVYDLNS